jgi:hypothetical protein
VRIDVTESGTDHYGFSLTGTRRAFINGGLLVPPAPVEFPP